MRWKPICGSLVACAAAAFGSLAHGGASAASAAAEIPVNVVGKVVGLKFGTIIEVGQDVYDVARDSPLEKKLFKSCRDLELCKVVGSAKPDGTLVRIDSAELVSESVATAPATGRPAATAAGPSFDCAKASSKVERLICGSPRLAKLDAEVTAAYKQARANNPEIRKSQLQWLAVRNGCADESCLIGAYEQRLTELGGGH
jgi:uncharacterized protein YecT (DUF1311 family)